MIEQSPILRLKMGGLALLCIFVLTVGGQAAGSIRTEKAQIPSDIIDDSGDSEYRIKALFIYRIARWITWPESNLPKKSKKIIIGIVGKDPFGKNIDVLTKLKPVKGRRIEIKRFKSVSDLRKTQVLFVSRTLSDADVKKVVAAAQRDSVLLVGEKIEFGKKGGMINFLIKDNKLKFEANIESAKKAKIKISAQILKMAIRIIKAK